MEELAVVTETAEARLLVVLADIGGEVGDGDGADVCGGFDGPDLFVGGGGGIGVFLDERLVVCGTFVGNVAGSGRGVDVGAG